MEGFDTTEIITLFRNADEDGNGTLEKNELRSIMDKISGAQTSTTEVEQLFNMMANGQGLITQEEFVKAMVKWLRPSSGGGEGGDGSPRTGGGAKRASDSSPDVVNRKKIQGGEVIDALRGFAAVGSVCAYPVYDHHCFQLIFFNCFIL